MCFKKFTALFLCAAVMLCCFGTVSADSLSQEELENEFSDISNSEDTEQITKDDETLDVDEQQGQASGRTDTDSPAKVSGSELLKVLGVIESDLESSAIITRAQFAAYLLRLSGNSAYIQSCNFYDVDKSNEFYGEICTVSGLGFINGFTDGSFRPDSPISYNEAVTCILRMAGYTRIAEAEGGYPYGYMKYAAKYNLLGSENTAFDYKSCTELLKNSLSLPVMKETGVSEIGQYVQSITDSSETVLNVFLHAQKISGYAESSRYAALNGAGYSPSGSIRVNVGGESYIFRTGETLAEEYVGSNVILYVSNNSDDEYETVLYAAQDLKKTEIIELKGSEVMNVNRKMTSLQYLKDGENKSRTAKIAVNANYIYNGASFYGVAAADLKPADGYIRLTDADLDGVYETVFIYKFNSYLVDTVTKDGRLSDKITGKVVELDTESGEYECRIYADGRRTIFENIREWDVVSVAESKNGKIKTAYVSANVTSGTVSEISDKYIVVDGIEIETAASFDKSKLNIGDEISLAVSYSGQAVGYVKIKESGGFLYGYVMESAQKSGISKPAQLKILCGEGGIKIYDVAKNATLNNAKSSPDAIASALSAEQIVYFRTNSDGEISKIYSGGDSPSGYTDFESNLVFNAKISGNRFYKSVAVVDGRSIITDDTVIFEILTDRGGKADEDNSFVHKKSEIFAFNESKPDVYTYNVSKDGEIGAMVIRYPYSTLTDYMYANSYNVFVVERVAETYGSDGNETYMASGYMAGEKLSVYARDGYSLKGWMAGDIRRLWYDENKNVLHSALLAADTERADTSGEEYAVYADTMLRGSAYPQTGSQGGIGDLIATAFGEVKSIDSSYNGYGYVMYELYDGTGTVKINPFNKTSRYYEYDTVTKKFRVLSSAADIAVGDKVFVYARNGSGLDIVVYK